MWSSRHTRKPTPVPDAKLDECLRKVFRIEGGFRVPQREVVRDLLDGRRVLLIQPTGWGKSLCYQMVAHLQPGLTLVFSPLKALMKDQCDRCSQVYGIPAARVDSSFTREENERTLVGAKRGTYRLLYIAPERLDNAVWRDLAPSLPISQVVVDEAHCISVWGHDFRPHYRKIVELVKLLLPGVPLLATTATANERVEADIIGQIGSGVRVYRGSMVRPNLRLSVVHAPEEADKLAYLARKLPKIEGPGIVYTATRFEAETVSGWLSSQGLSAAHYHAGLEDDERRRLQEDFMRDRFHTVAATVALGMGIDKPNIRFVIHYHIPGSPVHYYQEIGRAGRDGLPARCILLFHQPDLEIQRFFIENAKPRLQDYESVRRHLERRPMTRNELLQETGLPEAAVRCILSDLDELAIIRRDDDRKYRVRKAGAKIDLGFYEPVREAREQELGWMDEYVRLRDGCLMRYLARCLGDSEARACGSCSPCTGVWDRPPASTPAKRAAVEMLDADLPSLEPRKTSHRRGYALGYHVSSRVGRALSDCKYHQGGPVPEWVVARAVEVLRNRYPLGKIDLVTAVPPTISGGLVEDFAGRVAEGIQKRYAAVVRKIRATRPQKEFRNSVTKERNLADAFAVGDPSAVKDRGILLIDDIWDSGKTFLVVGRTLLAAGALAVWPFAITKTAYKQDR